MMNHFEASKKLMNRPIFQKMKIQERIDLGFVDSDFVPLMCQENYLSSCKRNLNYQDFRNLVKATDSLVSGDIITKKIRKNQEFTLMPNQMFMECVYPTEMVSYNIGNTKFTSWLGKFSSQRKTKRLIRELTGYLSTKTNTTFSATKK